MKTLFLTSPTLKDNIVIDLTQSPTKLAETKKNPSTWSIQLETPLSHCRGATADGPVTIKEGVEYSVGVTFSSAILATLVPRKPQLKVTELRGRSSPVSNICKSSSERAWLSTRPRRCWDRTARSLRTTPRSYVIGLFSKSPPCRRIVRCRRVPSHHHHQAVVSRELRLSTHGPISAMLPFSSRRVQDR